MTDVAAGGRLRDLAASMPTGLALSGRDGYVRYRELDQAADRVAAWLLAELGRGRHRVGLCVSADHAALVAALGLARSGKICVPLDPALSLSVLERVCADASVSLVLTDLGDVLDPDALGAPLAAVSDCVQPRGKRAPTDRVADPRPGLSSTIVYADPEGDVPAGIVTTDATVLRWSGALERAEVAGPGVSCAVAWAGSSPAGLEHVVALALAGTCAVTGVSDQELAALLAGGNADTLLVDAPLLHRLAAMGPPGEDMPPVRAVGLLGGPVTAGDVAVARTWLGADVAVSAFYAPAETGVVAVMTVPPGEEVDGFGLRSAEPLPAGWCLPDLEVEIVDATGCRVGENESGHVVVWGPDLPGAYWANPARTELRWLAGPGGRRWCRTGDRGRWDRRGCLVVEHVPDGTVDVRDLAGDRPGYWGPLVRVS